MFEPRPLLVDALQWDGTNQAAIEEAVFSYMNLDDHLGTTVQPDGTLVIEMKYLMTVTMPPNAYLVSAPAPAGVPRPWNGQGANVRVMPDTEFNLWYAAV